MAQTTPSHVNVARFLAESVCVLPRSSAERGFRKSELLYNLDGALRDVVVVEGVFDCWKVAGAMGEGSCQCVALLGSSLSVWQEEKLVEHFDRIVFLLDWQ